MSKKPNGYWTYERCKEVCLRYDKKNVLQKEHSSVYNAIFNNGLNYTITWLYKEINIKD
jgi:hypothetical protein